MSPVVRIDSVCDPRVASYATLTESQLRNRENIFIVESPKVIMAALESGLRPESMLCEEKHIEGDASSIIEVCPEMTVFTSSREILRELTGYTLTRGVLCAFRRPEPIIAEKLCETFKGKCRVAVIDRVCDATNIGSIFRSAAALGIDAILLSPEACDPLNRRVVRVSMGTVFKIPWAYLPGVDYLETLSHMGFKTVAMALTTDSVTLEDEKLRGEERLALILGEEGYGLPKEMIEAADYRVCIPMHRKVDSLNVGVAAAIAFYRLG